MNQVKGSIEPFEPSARDSQMPARWHPPAAVMCLAAASASFCACACAQAAELPCGFDGAVATVGTTSALSKVARPALRAGATSCPNPAFTTGDAVPKNGLGRTLHPNGQLERAAFHAAGHTIAFAEFTTRGELSRLQCGDRPVLAPLVDDARLCGFPARVSQLSFLSENGTIHARGTYQGGKRIAFETYQNNGLTLLQEQVLPGGRIERTYGIDGTLRREVTWAVDAAARTTATATRQTEREFNAQGVLSRERQWQAGVLASEATYFPDGHPRSKARYMMVGSRRLLETREFHENGSLAAEGHYRDTGRYAPIPTGIHRQLDAQGRLRAEAQFDDRGRLRHERTWDVAGKPLRDDEVAEDGSRRPITRETTGMTAEGTTGVTASVP